jgi:hypothetical protein
LGERQLLQVDPEGQLAVDDRGAQSPSNRFPERNVSGQSRFEAVHGPVDRFDR